LKPSHSLFYSLSLSLLVKEGTKAVAKDSSETMEKKLREKGIHLITEEEAVSRL